MFAICHSVLKMGKGFLNIVGVFVKKKFWNSFHENKKFKLNVMNLLYDYCYVIRYLMPSLHNSEYCSVRGVGSLF